MTELRGKRLGEAVLKEVMGYKDYGAGHKQPPLFDAIRQKGAIFVLRSPELTWRQWRWHSLDDVWEVVEKLRQMQYGFFLNQLGQAEWRATFGRISFKDGDAFGKIANEAILKAALKTVRQNQHLTRV